MAAAGDSVAAVAVVPVESAIAGKRFTPIEQAKGCHENMAPFFFDAQASIRRCVMQWEVSMRCQLRRLGTERGGEERTTCYRPRSDSSHCVLFAGTLTHHDGEDWQGH